MAEKETIPDLDNPIQIDTEVNKISANSDEVTVCEHPFFLFFQSFRDTVRKRKPKPSTPDIDSSSKKRKVERKEKQVKFESMMKKWSGKEQRRVRKALFRFGLGPWKSIHKEAKLKKKTEQEVEEYCRALSHYCQNIKKNKEVEELEGMVDDLMDEVEEETEEMEGGIVRHDGQETSAEKQTTVAFTPARGLLPTIGSSSQSTCKQPPSSPSHTSHVEQNRPSSAEVKRTNSHSSALFNQPFNNSPTASFSVPACVGSSVIENKPSTDLKDITNGNSPCHGFDLRDITGLFDGYNFAQ